MVEEKLLYDIAVILVNVANKREKITYNKLSERLNRRIEPINLGNPIGELSFRAFQLGLPLISVLVVNQDTQIPSDGYFKFSSKLKGLSESEILKDFENEIKKVYECKKWDELLDSLKEDKDNCFLQVLFHENCKLFFHSIASPFSTILQAHFPTITRQGNGCIAGSIF